ANFSSCPAPTATCSIVKALNSVNGLNYRDCERLYTPLPPALVADSPRVCQYISQVFAPYHARCARGHAPFRLLLTGTAVCETVCVSGVSLCGNGCADAGPYTADWGWAFFNVWGGAVGGGCACVLGMRSLGGVGHGESFDFILFVCFVWEFGSAGLYLATSFAFSLGLYRESTYAEYEIEEAEERRRIFWLLFITERLAKPVILRNSIYKPQVLCSGDPILAYRFINLINIFKKLTPNLYNWVSAGGGDSTLERLLTSAI
ncbi:Transcription factor, partial [Penicillium desertorum]